MLPAPRMAAEDCPVCAAIGGGGARLVKGGTLEYDTIPAGVQRLSYFMRLGEQVATNWLDVCPTCDRLYHSEESYEYLVPESEDYESCAPISPEAVLKLAPVSWAAAAGKAEIHAHDDGTWCIVRDPEKAAKVVKNEDGDGIAHPPKQAGGTSGTRRPNRTHAAARDATSTLLVQEILAAAGQPIAGHTMSVREMKEAVEEGRVLQVLYWSNFGDGEASFGFAGDFGVDGDGRVHPSYLVFPRPIPPSLRRPVGSDWESADEVFAAFGIGGE